MQTVFISIAALSLVLSDLIPLQVQAQPIPWLPPGADANTSIGNSNNNNNNSNNNIDDIDDGPTALQIGEYYQKYISSNDDESQITPTITMGGNRKEYMLHHKDASYLSVHIQKMYINPFCRLRIYDTLGNEKDLISGQKRRGLQSFWANHVPGDTMYIVLDCYENDRGQSHYASFFEIDQYVAGYTNDQLLSQEDDTRKLQAIHTTDSITSDFESQMNRDLTLCNGDDSKNAVCYAKSVTTGFETEYTSSKAVARLVIGGARACTGWLVGNLNMLITNQHCIKTEEDALNTDFEFLAETTSCDDTSGNCPLCGPQGKVYKATSLLYVDQPHDLALIQLDGNPSEVYG